ncbi:MAG TPA: serine/threonine-protein kinase [Polyangiales bacterium]|nr:serine/threonine-protein kinase [Polyangiales bacterium]
MALQKSDSEPSSTPNRGPREEVSATHSRRRTVGCLRDGLRFGKYQIVRLIALGGMSEVYEAVHNGLNKRVALKVLRPDLAENPEARERFVSEGVNAARIRHTNVVDVTDVGIVDDLPYLVMSLLEGEDLGAVYERQGRIPVADLVDLMLPVASAVAIGHAHGVVHRDLKPDNIFLHREGCRVIPKVLDFGVSRVMTARRITLNASVFGTPHYMSPEQARGAMTDARTDQYALGVILYEGVTGRLPRDSHNPLELLHAVAFDSFPPPSDHIELPRELEAVILRAMSQDAEERFASMRDLAMSLLPFASPGSREYWSIELRSMPLSEPASGVVPPVARHPSYPPGSPLSAAALRSRPVSAELVLLDSTAAEQALAPVMPLRSHDPQAIEAVVAQAVPRRSSSFWPGAAAGALLAIGLAWAVGGSHGGTPASLSLPIAGNGPPYFDVDVQVTPPSAAVLLDGQQVAIGRYAARVQKDGRSHELRALASGYLTRSVNFRDEPPPSQIDLTPSAPEPPPVAEPVAKNPATRASTAQQLRSRTLPRTKAASADATPAEERPAPAPHMAVIEQQRPKVRIVDEPAPRVRVIE